MSNNCTQKMKFKNGFGLNIELSRNIYDIFDISTLIIGVNYNRRKLVNTEGLNFDSNGVGVFFRFTSIWKI